MKAIGVIAVLLLVTLISGCHSGATRVDCDTRLRAINVDVAVSDLPEKRP